MHGGWFIGDFEPAVLRTPDFEVCIKRHPKGEKWDVHFHKVAVEFNCLVSGRMRILDRILEADDIFVLEPGEVADPEFIEDCTVVVVKVPSVPDDKHVVT